MPSSRRGFYASLIRSNFVTGAELARNADFAVCAESSSSVVLRG